MWDGDYLTEYFRVAGHEEINSTKQVAVRKQGERGEREELTAVRNIK
jgi:hypothetical protein